MDLAIQLNQKLDHHTKQQQQSKKSFHRLTTQDNYGVVKQSEQSSFVDIILRNVDRTDDIFGSVSRLVIPSLRP
jgi:hypothetical protein